MRRRKSGKLTSTGRSENWWLVASAKRRIEENGCEERREVKMVGQSRLPWLVASEDKQKTCWEAPASTLEGNREGALAHLLLQSLLQDEFARGPIGEIALR